MGVLSRKFGIAVVAASAAIMAAASSVSAADMAPPPMLSSDDSPVTFASGWYLRGDIGVAKDISLDVGGTKLPVKGKFPNSWSLDIGGGYKFNDWFRSDVTLTWRAPRSFNGNTSSATCITGWGPPTYAGVIESPFTDTCSDQTRARVNNFAAMVNGYIDLGNWSGVTPYIGGGVGVNYIYQRFAQNWFMSNGVPYQITTADYANSALTWYYNWDQARVAQRLQLAFSGMAGIAYSISPNTQIDIGYRYMYLGKIAPMASLSAMRPYNNNVAQEVRVGLRYTPD